MPAGQAIVNLIDQNFNGSIGNWIDDAVWEYGPIYTRLNIAALPMPSGETWKSMSLLYPYLDIIPEKTYLLQFNVAAMQPAAAILMQWELTDGTIYLEGEQLITGADEWVGYATNVVVPVGFDPSAATFIIIAQEDPHLTDDGLYIDDVSLSWETTSRQYLPLMGIG